MKQLFKFLVPALCGMLMHVAAFPDPHPLVAIIAPVGALLMCLENRPTYAFLAGFIYGLFANAIALHNLLSAIHIPLYGIAGFIFINSLFTTLIFGFSRYLLPARNHFAVFPWLFAALQSLLYLIAEHPMIGGHMIPLTASQYQLPPAHFVAAAGGQYLLLFILGLISASITTLFKSRTRTVKISVSAAGFFCILSIASGYYASSGMTGNSITYAALVHKKDPQLSSRWSALSADSVTLEDACKELTAYEQLTNDAVRKGAKLVIWNEYALQVRSAWKDSITTRISSLSANKGTDIIACYIDRDLKYNQAVHFSPSGQQDSYEKKYLVPLDESLWLNRGNKDYLLFQVNNAPVKPAVRICYDNDFPSPSREAVLLGANLLIIPAADWKEIADLHFAAQTFRASENGVPMIRAASNGISAMVDNYGRVKKLQYTYSRNGMLIGDVSLTTRNTFYRMAGNWILFVSAFILLSCLVKCLVPVKSQKAMIS